MMNSPVFFAAGLALCFAALAITVLVVLAPQHSSLPLNRRRPTGASGDSALTTSTNVAVTAIERVLAKRPGSARSGPLGQTAIDEAGLTLRRADVVLMLLSGIVLSFLLGLAAGSVALAAVLAVAVPIAGILLLKTLAARRRAQFDEQLGDALLMLSGGMRAGHSLLRSVDAVAQESDGPMAQECARAVNESMLGRDVGESLEQTAVRMRNDDFRWLAQAIAIHREVGGNLAEVLDQVGNTIRERAQVKRQVRALSAEGRMSALVLLGLPVVMAILLSLINPGYLAPLTSNPLGIALLAAGALLVVIGGLWLRKLVQIKF